MEQILRLVHFKMFEISQREKKLRENHPTDNNENIRNDQSISECSNTRAILEDIEKSVFHKLRNS